MVGRSGCLRGVGWQGVAQPFAPGAELPGKEVEVGQAEALGAEHVELGVVIAQDVREHVVGHVVGDAQVTTNTANNATDTRTDDTDVRPCAQLRSRRPACSLSSPGLTRISVSPSKAARAREIWCVYPAAKM